MALDGKTGGIIPIYNVLDYVQAFILSVSGAIVALISLAEKTKTKITPKRVFVAIIGGGFAGMMALYFCEAIGLSGPFSAFLIGAAGNAGPNSIIALAKRHPAFKSVFQNTHPPIDNMDGGNNSPLDNNKS